MGFNDKSFDFGGFQLINLEFKKIGLKQSGTGH